MTTRTPFDENTLRALFEEVEAPQGLEDRWRAGSAKRARPPVAARVRAAAVILGVLTVGGVVFGVMATHRQPAPGPEVTITEVPSTSSQAPPTVSSAPDTAAVPQEQPGGGGSPVAPGAGGGGPTGTTPSKPTTVPAPARGPLPPGEWPSAINAGVPAGTPLTPSTGDLHVTEPGAIVSDRTVNGTVFVEAPDVTLRRVMILPLGGAVTGVRQTAPRLRIEDSDISGAGGRYAVLQEAAGLTVSRSDVHGATTMIAAGSDTTVVDSYLHSSAPGVHSVSTNGGARLVVRHSTLVDVALLDGAGPVVDVTIENNRLTAVGAPTGSGSHDIRVRDNRFTERSKGDERPVCTGWTFAAPGNVWFGNVWGDSADPVNPND